MSLHDSLAHKRTASSDNTDTKRECCHISSKPHPLGAVTSLYRSKATLSESVESEEMLYHFTLMHQDSLAEITTLAESATEALELAKYHDYFDPLRSKLRMIAFKPYEGKVHKDLFQKYLEDRYRLHLEKSIRRRTTELLLSKYKIFTISSTIPGGCEGAFQVIAKSKDEAIELARGMYGSNAYNKGLYVLSQRDYNHDIDQIFMEEHLCLTDQDLFVKYRDIQQS